MDGFFFSVMFIFTSAQAVSILNQIDAKFEGSTFVTELKFDQAPKTNDILIEYINQTIQINLPNSTVKTGKFLKRIEQESVKSIYSYQFDKNLMRTRIIFEKPIVAQDYEGFVKLERKDNSIFINIYDPVMAKKTDLESAEFEIVPPTDIESEINKKLTQPVILKTKAEEIVAQELSLPSVLPEKTNEVIKDIKENSKEVNAKKNIAKGAESEEKTIPLFQKRETSTKIEESNYSRLIYSLLIVVIFGAGLVVFAKWWQKNHKLNDKNTKIQVLTQHHLGTKKSLFIIRVAGESILIGVTEQNINMIKTLSFIDDEVMEDVPDSFNGVMTAESDKPDDEIVEQKVTFDPEEDLVEDLHKQVSGRLKQLRDI